VSQLHAGNCLSSNLVNLTFKLHIYKPLRTGEGGKFT